MVRLSNISTYRTALMGIAIVFVFLYHCTEASCFKLPILKYAHNGTHAVNIFMLLSAFGLCYSLYRNHNIPAFYKRRFIRIFPTYWFVIGAYHLLAVILLSFMPEYDQWVAHPHSLIQSLYYYSTLGWWCHPQGLHVYYYDWYVPTIVLFYLLFPLMAKYACNVRRAVILTIASFAVSIACTWLYDIYDGENFLFLSFTRLPVFALGILLYYLKDSHDIRRGAVAVAICLALIAILHTSLLDSHSRTQTIFISTVVTTLYTTGLCVLLAMPMHIDIIKKCLDFLGSISLELYLVHMIVIAAVRKLFGWQDWQVVLAFIVSVALAWLVNKVAGMISRRIAL